MERFKDLSTVILMEKKTGKHLYVEERQMSFKPALQQSRRVVT